MAQLQPANPLVYMFFNVDKFTTIKILLLSCCLNLLLIFIQTMGSGLKSNDILLYCT